MKKTKKLVKFFIWSVLGFVIITGLLAARLAMGPMSAQFLESFIKSPIENAFSDLYIDFNETKLNWNIEQGTLELQLSDVTVMGKEATIDASFPYVGITFSKEAMFRGQVFPSRINLNGADVTLDWDAAHFDVVLKEYLTNINSDKPISGTGLTIATDQKSDVIELVERLLNAPDKVGLFGYLIHVGVSNAQVTLIENATQVKWHSPDAKFNFRRAEEGFDLDFSFTLLAGGGQSYFSGTTQKNINENKVLSLKLDNLNISELAQTVNLTGKYLALNFPIYGAMDVSLNKGILNKVDFDIATEQGTIILPDIFDTPPHFDDIELVGFYDFKDHLIFIDELSASLGGTQFEGDGLIEFSNEVGLGIRFIGDLEEISLRTLLNYWPPKVAKGGREWIDANIPEGTISSAKFTIDIKPGDLIIKPLPETAFRVDFQFDDLKAHYLRPMPIIERSSGYGHTTSNYLEINIEKGTSDGLNFAKSVFKIKQMADSINRHGYVSLKTEGRVRKVLQFIDKDPLNFTSRFGIDPMKVTGDIIISSELDFPILKGTTLKDVDIKAEATLTNVAMPDLVSNGGLQKTNLDMTITREGLTAQGNIELKGAPFELYWTDSFLLENKDALSSRFDLRGVLNKEQLINFGIPLEDIMTGTIRTRMVVEGHGSNLVKGHAENDLFSGGFKSALLGWEKKINTPGRVVFDLSWKGDQFLLENIVADTVGLYTKGYMVVDRNTSELLNAQFTEFKTQGNKLTLMAKGSLIDGFDLVVDSEMLDVGPLLETLSIGKGPSKIPPMSILIMAKEAKGLNGVEISNLHLSAHNSGDYWEWVDISGEMKEQSSFTMTLSANENGLGRELKLTSNDAGKLALAAGLFINGEGGILDLSAHLNDKNEPPLISGELNIDDFKLVKSSALVEALAAAKGKEVDSMIGKNGLSFSELNMPFVLQDGIFDISDAGAHGPSVGFTMQGQLDQAMKEINVNGVILPVYALNSLLGSIPIVGKILTGGDGGLFGVTYRIEGSTETPKVSVNPLSAFAPGFLRKIFQGKKGKLAPNINSEPEDVKNSPENTSSN